MQISCNFDSGNIIVKSAKSVRDIRLQIRLDHKSHFYQWFHYRLSGAKGKRCVMRITNAGKSAYPKGWPGYRACASYDREDWFRVPTTFDGKSLVIRHKPERDAVYYAYFAPYSMERHADLVAGTAGQPGVELEVLGQTLDGQDMDLLKFDAGNRKKPAIWVTARQHPGETMAEWWMEGFLGRLTDLKDPVTRKIRRKARFFVVPNMNPDGSRRGHLRTNAAGVNLNREWGVSSMKKSPEVHLVVKAMRRNGLDFHLDVHGDEEIPYNFLIGFEGIPKPPKQLMEQAARFASAMERISPDFQTKHNYPKIEPGKADMTISSNFVAQAFKRASMTLEMPFKDHNFLPDRRQGWSPERSIRLGRAFLDGLYRLAREL